MIQELIVVGLATWQAVEMWQHASILASARARAELLPGHVGELLGCPFCCSPWVALVLYALLWAPFGYAAVLALAASRLANLGNDVFHSVCRTPDNTTINDTTAAVDTEKPQ